MIVNTYLKMVKIIVTWGFGFRNFNYICINNGRPPTPTPARPRHAPAAREPHYHTAMRVLIVNTSEKTGGAAVAANRLMEALKNNGVKAKMLVRDKETDLITVVATPH